MSYRIILRGQDGTLFYSNGYDDEEGALRGAQLWAGHDDLEVLRIERSDGEVVSPEILLEASSAREPRLAASGAAS